MSWIEARREVHRILAMLRVEWHGRIWQIIRSDRAYARFHDALSAVPPPLYLERRQS